MNSECRPTALKSFHMYHSYSHYYRMKLHTCIFEASCFLLIPTPPKANNRFIYYVHLFTQGCYCRISLHAILIKFLFTIHDI